MHGHRRQPRTTERSSLLHVHRLFHRRMRASAPSAQLCADERQGPEITPQLIARSPVTRSHAAHQPRCPRRRTGSSASAAAGGPESWFRQRSVRSVVFASTAGSSRSRANASLMPFRLTSNSRR